MLKLLLIITCLLSGCSLPDASYSDKTNSQSSAPTIQNPSQNKQLNPYAIPKDCQLRKMFAFKVVCDSGANIFGVDHSFVESLCQSEIDILEGMPSQKAFHFLKERAEFFSKNIDLFHKYSERPIYRNMNGVSITPLIRSNYSDQVRCFLNNGRDEVIVNAHIAPYCNDNSGVYHYERCGVQIRQITIRNNDRVIQSIEMPDDSISPAVGYELNSGFIYKNFSPLKRSGSVFGNAGNYNPEGQNIYMKQDIGQFLDKYR